MENVLRCPGCSAAVRPNAQWCSLCYRDLRPAPEPRTVTSSTGPAASTSMSIGPLLLPAQRSGEQNPTGPAGTASVGGWPCATCNDVVPLDLDVCPACGSAFLARLAGDGGRHRSGDRKAGSDALRALPRSARLITGLVLGLLFAIFIPVLLALFG